MISATDYIEAHRDVLLQQADEWLRIPGISAQPEHHDDVKRSAEWFADALRSTGFPIVEIWPTAGLPTVFAEWPSAEPDAPIVLIYGHHDVQPVDPVEQWHADPFTPTIVGDLMHARGASDDKGQLLFHLLGVRAHLAATGRATPAVTLKLLIEGEEESGSPNFAALLNDHRARLDCDVVVVTDTGMVAADIPSTVTGMRGLVLATVTVRGPGIDLHSGVFGGAVPNPATTLARLIAALHDEQGRIAVPGFYDDVADLNEYEQLLFDQVPFDEREFLRTTQSFALTGEAGYTTLERIGCRPTAEVNGIGGGYQGEGGKTIIPTEAFAKISFRLVANQRPDIVREHVDAFIRHHTLPGTQCTVEWEGDGVTPCIVSTNTAAYEALTRAISAAFDGRPVLPTREGGSGPEATIQAILDAPMVFLGVGLPDDQIHAPNEKVSLSMLFRGAHAAAQLWSEFAAVGSAALRVG